MKRLLALMMFVLPLLASGRQNGKDIFLSMDSLVNDNGYGYQLDGKWRFYAGDDLRMSQPGYDDSKWPLAYTTLDIYPGSSSQSIFNGIGWFRLHFTADSSITGVPLALIISHLGASEIYLDGRKIISNGHIAGKDSTVGVDPQFIPRPFVIPAPGAHVLAVRYANFNAARYYKRYHCYSAGFTMSIGQGNRMIEHAQVRTRVLGFVSTLMFGIFAAFAVLHFFLYLYSRESRSNLFFSIFCLSIALAFLIAGSNAMTMSPAVALNNRLAAVLVRSLACYSFSGFINELFSTSKTRFRIFAAVCFIVLPGIWFINSYMNTFASFTAIMYAFVEAIVLTVNAVNRKVRGAKIIAVGILTFTLFFLGVVLFTTIFRDPLDDSTIAGRIILLMAGAAILSLPVFMSLYLAWDFGAVNRDLKNQLVQVKILSDRNMQQELEKQRMLEGQNEKLEEEVSARTAEVVAQKERIEKQHGELKVEKEKSDSLLRNILPEEIAEELKEKGASDARLFNNVTVMFTDFVDFTKAGEQMSAKELVDELHECFKAFDGIISRYNIEKIKTIGDAYLAVCGLPVPDERHAAKMLGAALEIRDFMSARRQRLGSKTFEVRIGVHSGSVVAGIVGVKKFAYDIWGDTVNTAARLEQSSEAGKINISQTTYQLVKNDFVCTYRGDITAKNKGEMSMYFVERRLEAVPGV